MPHSDNEGLLPQSNRSKMFWAQHQIPGGAVAAASLPFNRSSPLLRESWS